MKPRRAIRLGVIAWLVLGAGCGGGTARNKPAVTAQDSAAVAARLAEYTRLVQQMDHHGIAQLYAPDGELGNAGANVVRGPEAIEKFLRGFDAYRVLAYTTVADTTQVRGREVYQAGSWRQRVRVPKGDTVEVHGRFRLEWVRGPDGSWLIHRLGAIPQR
jgi:uncharacterized protein (TIGR02246 family)